MPNDLQLDSDRVVTVAGAPASRVKTRTERYRAERVRTAEVSSPPDAAPDLYAATSNGLQAAVIPQAQTLPPLVIRRSGIYRLVPGFVPPIPLAPPDGHVSQPARQYQLMALRQRLT